ESWELVSILYFAVHYFDTIRSFMGNPSELHAKTVTHRQGQTSAATRSCTVLNYGDTKIATIVTNHHRAFDCRHQEAYLRWEGDCGLIQARFEPNSYSSDRGPDVLEYCCAGTDGSAEWRSVNLRGKWIPDAFIGTMASLMRVLEGS